MQGAYLRIYTTELRKHDGELLYEWLLERAKALGIPGGSAFRAAAGYGRHGTLHGETFFELAADLPVEIVFALNEDQAQQLLNLLRAEQLKLLYIRTPAEIGVTGET